MPRKKTNVVENDIGLLAIPAALLDQFVTGPMTAESVEAVMSNGGRVQSFYLQPRL